VESEGVDRFDVQNDELVLRVDRQVYSDEAIFRTCYIFTDRCYLFLDRDGSDHISIRFRRRQANGDLRRVVDEFGNELINQRLRIDLARDTRDIRQLIVSRAFADAEFNEP
jgi:His-Xaa-Ser system protein HxsD